MCIPPLIVHQWRFLSGIFVKEHLPIFKTNGANMNRIRRLVQSNASFVFDGQRIIHPAGQKRMASASGSRRIFASEPEFDRISRTREPISSRDMDDMLLQMETEY